MAPDLSSTLDRIASHIPCLERAAADETAPMEVRSRVAAMVQLTRSATEVAGQAGTPQNETERNRTEG